MDITKPLFVLSRYNEDPSWILEYTDNYIIFNKGEPLEEKFKSKQVPNIGGNQYDISWFVWNHYENLPDIMIFVQAFPWDHCNREKFDKLIDNKFFTPLESYEHVDTSPGTWMRLTPEGGFMEKNNSWYISAHNSTHDMGCRYHSYDQFMHKYFENYEREEYIRFSPGSQYLVTKKDVKGYPKEFWKSLALELPKKSTTEANIVERALWYILTNKYRLKEGPLT